MTNLALGVTPLLERQPSRRHLIFRLAIRTFEDDHFFTVRLRLMIEEGLLPDSAADRDFLLGKSIIKESPEYP